MAYNSGINPDALPAHAEPEQILSYQQQRKQSNPPHPAPARPYSTSNPQPYDSPQQQPQYQSKPPPPLPKPVQQSQVPFLARVSPNNSYNNTQFNQNAASSSPSQSYGFGAPPQAHHGRPPPPSRPPGTPGPSSSSSANASLFPLFKAVDVAGVGQLTERELGKALVNGDFTSFDSHTVKMMIRMFDTDKDGKISFEEFCGLWGFLAAWRALFDRFDEDGSGYISFDEYTKALVAFGYRLSSTFVNLLYTTYDKSREDRMSFDLFVQSCIILKRMTDVFKQYDDDRDGYITLSFEEFLTALPRNTTPTLSQ
ncbi:hypothetical protein BDR22DRAFT_818269 [Usnea florida]